MSVPNIKKSWFSSSFSIGFLHVRISVSYLVIHQMSLGLKHFVLEPRGNVTFVVVIYSLAGSLIPVRLWVFTFVS